MPPDRPSTARSKPAWRSWPRMNSPMTRRATSVSIASSVGSSNATGLVIAASRRRRPRPGGSRSDAAPRSPGATSRPGSAPGSLVVSCARPGPLGDDPAQLADLELRPLVAQQRQPDPLAPDVGDGDVDA